MAGAGIAGVAIGAGLHAFTEPTIGRPWGYAANYVFTTLQPSPAELFWAYRTGCLDLKTVQGSLRMHGIMFAPTDAEIPPNLNDQAVSLHRMWGRVYQSQEPMPPLGEILTLLNRGQITDLQARWMLGRQGHRYEEMKDRLLSLRNEIPGPSDLVRFAVRHVWEPDLIARFGYNDEFRPAFNYWHGQQGLAYDARSPDEVQAGRDPYTWANAFWWAHWILPSPTQGYMMVQRLRASGGENGGPRDPSGQVFTTDDLKLLLRANDYPPFWRDKLLAISYNVIGIRQVRQLVQFDLVSKDELVEMFQDQGYHPTKAGLLADMTFKVESGRRYKTHIAGVKGKVLNAYKVGVLPYETTLKQIYRLTREDQDQVSDFDNLPAADQLATAVSDPPTVLQVQGVDQQFQATLAAQGVAAVKRQYVKGVLDRPAAQAELSRLGIVPDRVQDYLDLWNVQHDTTRKEFSTAQILRYYHFGFLQYQTASTRLINLGWQQADIDLMLKDVDRQIALDQAKQAVAVARNLADKQKALARQVQAARQEHNRARSELARHGTPAQLKKWLARGLVGEPEVRTRLAALDWPQADIDRLIAEAFLPPPSKAKATPAPAATTGGSTP